MEGQRVFSICPTCSYPPDFCISPDCVGLQASKSNHFFCWKAGSKQTPFHQTKWLGSETSLHQMSERICKQPLLLAYFLGWELSLCGEVRLPLQTFPKNWPDVSIAEPNVDHCLPDVGLQVVGEVVLHLGDVLRTNRRGSRGKTWPASSFSIKSVNLFFL